MKFLMIFVFSFSFVLNLLAADSMAIFPKEDSTTVVINEVPLNKLKQIFNGYDGGLILIKVSQTEDITMSCKRRINAGSCTFSFLRSEDVYIKDKYTEVLSESENSQDFWVENDIALEFKNTQGETFYLKITPSSFYAEVQKK